jgi:hypothetical protein
MMSLGNGTLKLPPPAPGVGTPGVLRVMERCMSWEPGDRPSFREILHMLETEYKVSMGTTRPTCGSLAHCPIVAQTCDHDRGQRQTASKLLGRGMACRAAWYALLRVMYRGPCMQLPKTAHKPFLSGGCAHHAMHTPC